MDLYQNEELKKKGVLELSVLIPIFLGVKYVEKDELLSNADIITLHAPLLPSTTHWLDATALAKCKQGTKKHKTTKLIFLRSYDCQHI